MGLKDVDIGAALRLLAERRIEEAIEAGKFDNLSCAGKPLDLEPLPADEEARAMYWAVRILRNADVVTDEMRYRRRISTLREEIDACAEEGRLVDLVREHNALVRRLNTMGTNAIRSTIGPLDEADEVARLKRRAVAG